MVSLREFLSCSNTKSNLISTSHALRIFASADKSSFYLRIADYKTRTLIHLDGGSLPTYYDGLEWNEATAQLYALARAAEWIKSNRPSARVAMTCMTALGSRKQGRERRTWAA
ncbi:MAG TPA: hypothetical protein VJX74_14595 [Blastocatellia bacterium]|nr:hypothetical protein [Blastocatellia bacterium]